MPGQVDPAHPSLGAGGIARFTRIATHLALIALALECEGYRPSEFSVLTMRQHSDEYRICTWQWDPDQEITAPRNIADIRIDNLVTRPYYSTADHQDTFTPTIRQAMTRAVGHAAGATDSGTSGTPEERS